ncbi:MAG: winged helix-turn-helix domain-containing protein [Reyranella sp.]|uniref:BTAD domain-containing putative transcriptional regulator n=1 Tax=Reyranella sp. TaxID=1929291 RepID=UPI0025D81298|nr:BTAD domain-containing putative transcriptional regulator [Reyranella sp.]MBR2816468.1 winged helix-turn-helix domain-containing protein [Reyranella sp.]
MDKDRQKGVKGCAPSPKNIGANGRTNRPAAPCGRQGTDAKTMSQHGKPAINLLGPFELRTGQGPSPKLPKKAQALLCFLAIGRGRPMSRDQLSTLLWGDTPTEQARQSLRQSLSSLRTALGAKDAPLLVANATDVMLAGGDGISVDTETFLDLSASAEIEDLERAGGLYRGELLAGLHVEADPFERWLGAERQKWLGVQLELQNRLAMIQAKVGRLAEAIASAQRVVELDPLNEPAHRLLMQLLARSEQRAAALRQYEQCREILHQELGVAPETKTVQLADIIRSGAPAAEIVPPLTKTSRSDRGEARPDKPSIVVLPFANLSGDPDRDYFVEGLVDDISVALGRESWLFVLAGPSAQALKAVAGDLSTISTKLGVRYVLKGSVRIAGDDVVLVAQLTDAQRAVQIWSERFRDRIDNIFALQERLTTRVAAMIAPALKSVEVDRARRKPTNNLTAYDLYLQALPRFRSSRQTNEEALALLRRAVELDPGYPTAHALAARCFQFQLMFNWRSPDDPGFAEGVRFAHRALEIGKDDSEALWMAALALVHLSGEIDHVLAQMERSLALNPNSANAWTASCFVHSYLGDSVTAIDHFQRAQHLNPLDLSQHVHWNAVAWAYLGDDRLEDAHDAAVRTLNVVPTYPPGLRMKLSTCGLLGRHDEARACVERLLEVQPGSSVRWLSRFLRAALQRNRHAYEIYIEGARRAGLPES